MSSSATVGLLAVWVPTVELQTQKSVTKHWRLLTNGSSVAVSHNAKSSRTVHLGGIAQAASAIHHNDFFHKVPGPGYRAFHIVYPESQPANATFKPTGRSTAATNCCNRLASWTVRSGSKAAMLPPSSSVWKVALAVQASRISTCCVATSAHH